jgi:hypothetical protein
MITGILGGEFVTASENLSLVTIHWADTRYYGQTLWWDVLATFRPSFLFPERRAESITNQFNMQLYRDVFASGGGQGFTLVGEGYVNFGVFGVVLWFVLIGLFARLLYMGSSKGLLGMASYVMAMPVLMIATRGDLSNIMSQCTKHIFLPIGLIALTGRVLSGRKSPRVSASGMAGRRAGLLAEARYPGPLSPVGLPVAGAVHPGPYALTRLIVAREHPDFRQH